MQYFFYLLLGLGEDISIASLARAEQKGNHR
jgi:hypothetical protein